jgi:hypothetical protein
MLDQTKPQAVKSIASDWLAQEIEFIGTLLNPQRPKMTSEVTPKTEVGIVKRKYVRKAKKRERPVGSGKRGPGRPSKAKSGRKPGRPKGKVGRPKASVAGKGLVAGLVAKAVKGSLKAQAKILKEQVKGLVAKEVKKALKAALR